MKELLPVGLFGPDYFDVEPDELIDIGNAGKETIRYIRADLLQKQIEEEVLRRDHEWLRLVNFYSDKLREVTQAVHDPMHPQEIQRRAMFAIDEADRMLHVIRNGEEAGICE